MYGELNINKITPLTGTSLIIRQWDGRIDANETWTYASADSPTFTFTITGDLTTKYWPGMRIKLFQTTVKYFIITAVAYASPNTTITVYGGTDYTLTSSAITLPYYSSMKAPHGFPLDPAKWTVELISTSQRETASPTAGVWYNAESITIPIGVWKLEMSGTFGAYKESTATDCWTTLSTANNTLGNKRFTVSGFFYDQWYNPFYKSDILVLTSKTTYYMNYKTGVSSVAAITIYGQTTNTLIRAVCAYL